MEMVKLIEPKDLGELAVMKSLLEGSGIPYFVQNALPILQLVRRGNLCRDGAGV